MKKNHIALQVTARLFLEFDNIMFISLPCKYFYITELESVICSTAMLFFHFRHCVFFIFNQTIMFWSLRGLMPA